MVKGEFQRGHTNLHHMTAPRSKTDAHRGQGYDLTQPQAITFLEILLSEYKMTLRLNWSTKKSAGQNDKRINVE